ncbi:putative lipoprotein YajG [Natronospira proteinivora]|uniref:Lipoprotein YajG n=1 Tax=Natronospira proteinivora TaxID=1807133 RepID=A0ABT1G4T7_9GAMM|nr:hypothetical protein [Natronospira proteinivora]MCP1726306.1 putative lipoprotein YajG [Natronospira proteinivora]
MKKSSFFLLVLSLLLTACTGGQRALDNIQLPESTSEGEASGEVYIKSIVDERNFVENPRDPSVPSLAHHLRDAPEEELSTLIGRQRAGIGAAMGYITLPEGVTVQDIVREVLVEGLESRGYTVVENGGAEHQVSVEVDQFWAWFSPGVTSVSFEKNIETSISFVHESYSEFFKVEGYSINRGNLPSSENWELAIEKALDDFLNNLNQRLDELDL